MKRQTYFRLRAVQMLGMVVFSAGAFVLLLRGNQEGWGWFIWAAMLCIPGCVA